jgi:hypothetical protein
MKKKWTKEEFIEETRKIMFESDPNILHKKARRRELLKKRRNKNAKP